MFKVIYLKYEYGKFIVNLRQNGLSSIVVKKESLDPKFVCLRAEVITTIHAWYSIESFAITNFTDGIPIYKLGQLYYGGELACFVNNLRG